MNVRSKSISSVLLFVLLVSLFEGSGVGSARAAGVLYAKPAATGSGNCSSWANACTLQTAIANSVSSDQIWVMAGTHRPHASDRTVSFVLKNGVAIYGGFAGTETLLSQRDPSVNPTILSGDLNGNDGANFANNGENSYHVVVGSGTDNTAILDGFTITAGNANGAGSQNSGGGMYNVNGNSKLANLTFNANSTSSNGGGMYNDGSSPTLTNVTFSSNYSFSGGGGMTDINNSSVILTNVTFSNNFASGGGGGMLSLDSTDTLINVTFSANGAGFIGGGAELESGVTLKNVIFANNTGSGDCSGFVNSASSNNLIEDTTFACGLTNGVNGNIVGQDPKLGALANNGGFTQTFALLSDSPAINAGTNTGCPSTDQRGVTRPIGNLCDIGAYEYNAPGTQAGPNFVVNTAADTNDGFCDLLGQGIINKDCSLRDAINAANAVSGADTITFAANYTITLAGSQLPAVSTPITITGNGSANSIIQANSTTYRVFQVTNTGNLTVDGLTVRNGRCDGSCATNGTSGGGILNDGILTVTNSAISNNSVDGFGSGGGINNGGTLAVTNSTISNNTAGTLVSGGVGGGINNGGTLTVTGTTFTSNSAYLGDGGGINNDGTATVMSSTFSGNYASAPVHYFSSGGGIRSAGTLTVINSTFSGNSASNSGGGIAPSGVTAVTNSTFSGNSASYGSGLVGGSNVTLKNVIIANKEIHASGGDCEGTLNAASGNNLIEGTGTNACGLTNGVNGNVIGSDPNLSVLANNGGPTLTMGLLPGSPAIDTGIDTGCPSTDQRGVTRPFGSHCDIGAYEVTAPTFTDVAYDYWAWQYIERLYNAGITGGCSTSPLSYCPTSPVTRAQMAIFLEKGIHGSSFFPANVAPTFTDTVGHFAEDWIEALKNDGVTSGCGAGIYCPESAVTRAQMAIFLLKAKYGSSYTPPNVSPTFGDTAGHFAEDWIEQLAAEGITSGCAAGLYCPESSVTRDQMAVFLVKAFGLP